MDRLYTLQEVADLTGFKRDSIRDACRDGRLGGLKLLSQWRVPEGALRVWLDSGRVERERVPVRRVDKCRDCGHWRYR